MITNIWWRGRFINVDIDKAPTDERQLISFLKYNEAPVCFVKTGNAWRKVNRQGQLVEVARALYLLSFKEWLKISKSE